jgi:hypothetical protein
MVVVEDPLWSWPQACALTTMAVIVVGVVLLVYGRWR